MHLIGDLVGATCLTFRFTKEEMHNDKFCYASRCAHRQVWEISLVEQKRVEICLSSLCTFPWTPPIQYVNWVKTQEVSIFGNQTGKFSAPKAGDPRF